MAMSSILGHTEHTLSTPRPDQLNDQCNVMVTMLYIRIKHRNTLSRKKKERYQHTPGDSQDILEKV